MPTTNDPRQIERWLQPYVRPSLYYYNTALAKALQNCQYRLSVRDEHEVNSHAWQLNNELGYGILSGLERLEAMKAGGYFAETDGGAGYYEIDWERYYVDRIDRKTYELQSARDLVAYCKNKGVEPHLILQAQDDVIQLQRHINALRNKLRMTTEEKSNE